MKINLISDFDKSAGCKVSQFSEHGTIGSVKETKPAKGSKRGRCNTTWGN